MEGITGKLKEAKYTKSYEIYKIISKFVTKDTLPNIVLPLKQVGYIMITCKRVMWGFNGKSVCSPQKCEVKIMCFDTQNALNRLIIELVTGIGYNAQSQN